MRQTLCADRDGDRGAALATGRERAAIWYGRLSQASRNQAGRRMLKFRTIRHTAAFYLALALGGAGCASIVPPQPRFVAVFEQRSDFCRIQILQDTRSAACFVAFRCGRQPVAVLTVDDGVCVP